MVETKKSTFGLEKNIAAAATYVLGWVTGLVFFFVEKDDKEIRFHALQSIIFFGGLHILWTLVTFTIIGIPFLPLLGIIGLVGWIFLIIKAYQGGKFKLPVIGEIAEKQANK